MILLLLVLVAAAVAGTVQLVLRDDRGPAAAPPASRAVDRASLPPASLLGRH